VELTHSFTVPATVAETWEAFGDITSVAECFPGAAVTSADGDDFEGICKVRLGPIALVYTGSGHFVSRDKDAGRLVMEAKGKDKRGNGTAGVTVTVSMAAEDTSTNVEVTSDLQITGRPAQFGRGVIQDVSDKLLQQFTACLEQKVGTPPEPEPVVAAAPKDVAASQSPPATRTRPAAEPVAATTTTTTTPSTPTNTAQPPRPDDALDLGATVVPVLVKSYWKPAVGGVVALVLVWTLVRRILR
jgi:uncharacterized protein